MPIYSEGPFRQWQAVGWPVAADGSVLVITDDGELFALDPEDLAITVGPVATSLSNPTGIDNNEAEPDIFYVQKVSGAVGAYDDAGSELWETGAGIGGLTIPYPAYLDGAVYIGRKFGFEESYLQAISADDGSLIDSVIVSEDDEGPPIIRANILGIVELNQNLHVFFQRIRTSVGPSEISRWLYLHSYSPSLTKINEQLIGEFAAVDEQPGFSLSVGLSVFHIPIIENRSTSLITRYEAYNALLARVTSKDVDLGGDVERIAAGETVNVVFARAAEDATVVTKYAYSGEVLGSSDSLVGDISAIIVTRRQITEPSGGPGAPVIIPLADQAHDSSSGFWVIFLTLSAGDNPLTWSFDSGNPAGMTIDGDADGGAILWATPVAGIYTITYRATNAAGFDTDEFVLTVT